MKFVSNSDIQLFVIRAFNVSAEIADNMGREDIGDRIRKIASTVSIDNAENDTKIRISWTIVKEDVIIDASALRVGVRVLAIVLAHDKSYEGPIVHIFAKDVQPDERDVERYYGTDAPTSVYKAMAFERIVVEYAAERYFVLALSPTILSGTSVYTKLQLIETVRE